LRTGTKPTSFALTAEEKAEIESLAERLSVSRKEAVLRAVRAFGKRELSRDELLAALARRLR
jgi:hypothetical protein